jgi:Spy/CpxP family protein refolding chaperone
MKYTIMFLLTAMIIVGCSDGSVSVQEPISFVSVSSDSDVQSMMTPPETPKKGERKVTHSPFVELLRSLNLRDEQKPLVERLLTQHKECTQSCIETLKTAEREILMNARIEEQKIKEAVKAGKITREVARRELAQLKKSTDEKLKSLPKDKVRKCLQECDTQFLNSLKEILTPEQKIILGKWIASRQKRGTTDDKNPKGRG